MSAENPATLDTELSKHFPKQLYVGGGMCAGVVRARDFYREFAKDHPRGTVYSVGQPAHNPHVNQEFTDMGVIFVESIEEVPVGMNAVEGPHGHKKQDEELASEIGGDYGFSECPLVTRVKNAIDSNVESGYQTIYYGQLDSITKKPHPETAAAMSMGNNLGDVLLVTSLEEALSDELYDQIKDPKRVAFACQTTHDAEEADLMAEKLEGLFPDIKRPKKPDYCYATHDRQETAKRANDEFMVDIIVVIGDEETSSNTRNLSKVAAKNLKKNGRVLVVNSFEELNVEDFYGSDSVAIIGSASTPPEQIQHAADSFVALGSNKPINIDVRDETNIRFPNLPVVHKGARPFIPQISWVDTQTSA